MVLESLLVPVVARLDDAIVARPVNERIHPRIGADGRIITDRFGSENNLESVVADGPIKKAQASMHQSDKINWKNDFSGGFIT